MTRWRGARAAVIAALLLGGTSACASHDGPQQIEGNVSFVPADKADQAGAANAGTNGAIAEGANSPDDVTAPEDVAPKGGDKKACAASVKASNALLDKRVVALFPANALRRLEHLTPRDTFTCDPKEGPDFGGVSALWKAITGADAIKLFEADGWSRQDPEGGAPVWASQALPHGDGSLNYEPAEQYVVTFHLTRGGRTFWAELTQDGFRAGLDDAA